MKKQKKLIILFIGITSILLGVVVTLSINISIQRNQANSEERVVPSKEALSLQNSFIEVANKVGPAVVNISTEQILKYRYYSDDFDDFFKRFFNEDEYYFFRRKSKEREFKRQGLGTGMLVTEDGYILTNYHVIKEVTKITVVLADKSKYEGKVTGIDRTHDMAVVKINANKKLPKVILGDSNNVKVGGWVIAIGNPFGYDQTVTAGIISAKGRLFQDIDEEGLRRLPNLIQTDAAINPGNSGGPLVNIYGEVIGINVAIVSTSGSYAGIGFAIPVNEAKKVLDSLIKGKKIISGTPKLGVMIQPFDEKLKRKLNVSYGVLISRIEENTPAKKAGLMPGDIILMIDDNKIQNVEDFITEITSRTAGDKIKLKIQRDKKEFTLEVKLSQWSAEKNKANEKDAQQVFGMMVDNINIEYVSKYNLSTQYGVVVTEVNEGSDAYSVDIQEGDVIQEIDKVKIRNMDDFNKVMKKVNLREGVLLLIKRGKSLVYVVISKSE